MKTFGSVCSGIEAAQIAFKPLGFKQLWSSEIAEFPSKVLKHHHPDIPNLGDMTALPKLIEDKKITAPDIFCGGTPCQAFSLAGWKNGLHDQRGQLTMTFIDIANAIDKVRLSENKKKSIIFWENVEGVLNNKTNAFGNFIAGLAGFDEEIKVKKWTKAGYIEGITRNVAWRVLDAKYFGLPQQRKRLYVVAGDKNFRPDLVLFEFDNKNIKKLQAANHVKNLDLNPQPTLFNFEQKRESKINPNIFSKKGIKLEVFREYTDCLYAAYGTKWNGNAAAYNGSLYVAQNDKLRRLTPLECERLMGIPDNHTAVKGWSHTNRFKAIGNSWAVPVIKWIGEKFELNQSEYKQNLAIDWKSKTGVSENNLSVKLYLLGGVKTIGLSAFLNTSSIPNNPKKGSLKEILETENIPSKFYLSPKACKGILRRKTERKIKMNPQVEQLMLRNELLFNVIAES